MISEHDIFQIYCIKSYTHHVTLITNTTLSDHTLIIFNFELHNSRSCSFPFPLYLNVSFLHSSAMILHIYWIYNLLPIPSSSQDWIIWWNSTISCITHLLQSLGVEGFGNINDILKMIWLNKISNLTPSLLIPPCMTMLQL